MKITVRFKLDNYPHREFDNMQNFTLPILQGWGGVTFIITNLN